MKIKNLLIIVLIILSTGAFAQTAGVFEGNVGIGVNNPSSTLHLMQPSGILSIQLKTGNSWTAKLSQSPSSILSLHNGGQDHFNLTANGQIGIGTTNPEAKLHIAGGSASQILLDNAGDLMWKSSSGLVKPVLTLHSDDNIYFDATSASTSEMIFRNNPSNIERMRIASDGKVGIGTSTPEAMLHIGGSNSTSSLLLENEGDLLWKNSDGVAKTVMTLHNDDNLYIKCDCHI